MLGVVKGLNQKISGRGPQGVRLNEQRTKSKEQRIKVT